MQKCFNSFSLTSASFIFLTPSSTFKEVTALPRIPQGILLSIVKLELDMLDVSAEYLERVYDDE